jgi:hypothetical protein
VQIPVERINTSRRVQKFRNKDLPPECHIGNAWRRAFIPSYIRYVASLKNPWVINDDDAVGAMKLIWDVIYPTLPYTITSKTSVFYIVSSPLGMWIFANAPGPHRLINVFTNGETVSDLLLLRWSTPSLIHRTISPQMKAESNFLRRF